MHSTLVAKPPRALSRMDADPAGGLICTLTARWVSCLTLENKLLTLKLAMQASLKGKTNVGNPSTFKIGLPGNLPLIQHFAHARQNNTHGSLQTQNQWLLPRKVAVMNTLEPTPF